MTANRPLNRLICKVHNDETTLSTLNRLHVALPAGLLAANLAWAADVHKIDIPAQSLRGALSALAEQTGLKTLYVSDDLAGKRAPAVSGKLTARAALSRLLQGSGLRFVAVDADTARIEPVAKEPAEPNVENAVQLPAMTVSGSPISGYSVPNASTATKTDTPIMETPVSIRAIPRAVLDDQQAFSLRQGLRFIAGVNPAFSFEGISNQAFTLRGFSTEVGTVGGIYYREGVRLQRIPTSVASLQRIELLKGPATVLYGRAQPGGYYQCGAEESPLFSVLFSPTAVWFL